MSDVPLPREEAPLPITCPQFGDEVHAVRWIVVLLLVLRLPTLWEPLHYGDEAIFAAVAQRLLQG